MDAGSIARRQFASTRKGFDQDEVRAYLRELADVVDGLRRSEAEQRARAEAAESRVTTIEDLDEHRLVELLGEETARILDAGRAASADIRRKAEESAERLISEANDEAHRLLAASDAESTRRRTEVMVELGSLRAEASAELDRRRAEGAELVGEIRRAAQAEADELIDEAQVVRERMLGDLSRRRRTAREQLERLNAARERLLAAYDVVRRTVDEATTELTVALPAARLAGETAMRRVSDEPEPTVEELEGLVTMARIAGLLDQSALEPEDDDDPADEPVEPVVSAASTPEPPSRPEYQSRYGSRSEPEARSDAAPSASAEPAEPAVSAPESWRRPGPSAETESSSESWRRPGPSAEGESSSESQPEAAEAPAEGPASQEPDAGASVFDGRAAEAESTDRPEPSVAASQHVAGSRAVVADAPSARWPAVPVPDGDDVQPEDRSAPAADEVGAAPTRPATLPAWARSPAGPTESDDDEPSTLPAWAAASPTDDEVADEYVDDEVDEWADEDEDDGVEQEYADEAPAATNVSDLFARLKADTEAAAVEASDVADHLEQHAGVATLTDDQAYDGEQHGHGEAADHGEQGYRDAATGDGTDDYVGHDEPGDDQDLSDQQAQDDSAADHGSTDYDSAADHGSTDHDGADDYDEDDESAYASAPVAGDDELVQQRDSTLAAVEQELNRRLKRVLADEQNEVLDLVRRTKPSTSDELLPALGSHTARYIEAAREELGAAAAWGAAAVGGEPDGSFDALAVELSQTVVEPLRERIARSFVDTGGDLEEVTGRLRSLYREWKGQHIAAAVRHYSAAAYAQGAYGAMPDGTPLRWLVDRTSDPCPDADDNALAGAVCKGEAFPTGDHCPPAHVGCRCMVVPAE